MRTSYMATHTEEDLDKVLEIFAKLALELAPSMTPRTLNPGSEKRMYSIFVWRTAKGKKLLERLPQVQLHGTDKAFIRRLTVALPRMFC